jgi:non-heme chloroperoxidase
MADAPQDSTTIADWEAEQIADANASDRPPVVFVHGLWLLGSSWDKWAQVFREAGYATLQPGWPDDPADHEAALADPDVFANKTVGQIADHYEEIIRGLDRKPALVGHSFGGLLVQILAGRGLAAATVAVDPAPFRGVLPLPLAALKSSSPVLRNPANRHRAVPLSLEQFTYGFANALDGAEAKELYETYSVPGPGAPVFQVAAANLNPFSELKVDTKNPERGPLLITAAEKDHTVPVAISHASFKLQKHNEGITELVDFPGRGHSLTIDAGWREVADTSLQFVQRFVSTAAA